MPSRVCLHVHAMLTSLAILYIVRLSLATSALGLSLASDLRVEIMDRGREYGTDDSKSGRSMGFPVFVFSQAR